MKKKLFLPLITFTLLVAVVITILVVFLKANTDDNYVHAPTEDYITDIVSTPDVEDFTVSETTQEIVNDISENLSDTTEPDIEYSSFVDDKNSFDGTFTFNDLNRDVESNLYLAIAMYNETETNIEVYEEVLIDFCTEKGLDITTLTFTIFGPYYTTSDYDYYFCVEDDSNYYTFYLKDNLVGYYIDAK